uniref:Putative capsid protein n=1 Tax=viral metagenome TaxID=1070528 RepID=A0A6M3J186_9ZZZZ
MSRILVPGIVVPGVDHDGRRLFLKSAIQDSAFTDKGKLLPIQAREFIKLLQNTSKLKGMVDFRAFNSEELYIETMDFTTRALFPQSQAADHGVYREPSLSRITLHPVRFSAVIKITDEALDVNIEGKNFAQSMVNFLTTQIQNDFDELIIDGNESGKLGQDPNESGYEATKYKKDAFLATVDGIVKLCLASANTLDVSGFTTKKFTPPIAAAMRNQLPINRQALFSQMKYLVSSNAQQDFRYWMGNKGAELSDKYWTGLPACFWAGVPVEDIPLLNPYPKQMKTWLATNGGTVAVDYPPVVANSQIVLPNGQSTYATPKVEGSDYTFTDATGTLINTGGLTAGTTYNITYQGSAIWILARPKNFVLALGLNDIAIEQDRDILTAQDIVVVRTRADVCMIDASEVVIAYGGQNDAYTSY